MQARMPVGLLGHLGTLLAPVQPAADQHPQGLFCRAALQPLLPRKLQGPSTSTLFLSSHPTAISTACLKPSWERILGDDVHQEVEPHDRQGQPDHRDLERLCGEKGRSKITALLLLKKMQGEESLPCPELTTTRDTPQLQEAVAALGRLRCGHIWILLQMESYLVLIMLNDKYKQVCRCFCLDIRQEERKMEEEAG